MSSVQRFIRQIQLASTYYSAASVVATPAAYAYQLTNGVMSTASSGLQSAISTAGANVILRDMGKTVRAPLSNGNIGFFRQVQLLAPVAVTSYIGGVGANNFGVNGEITTNYLTFYVPIIALGVSSDAGHVINHTACGQQ